MYYLTGNLFYVNRDLELLCHITEVMIVDDTVAKQSTYYIIGLSELIASIAFDRRSPASYHNAMYVL